MEEYKHFSHPHALKLQQIRNQEGSSGSVCSGCESAISGPAYTCSHEGCSFFLHQQCGNAARGMQHPSHPLHRLTLLPCTTYSSGTFLCNACGSHGGKGFSYCCPLCDFDLHARCALLPHIMVHESHPSHNLVLVYNTSPPNLAFPRFGFPNQFVCSLCNRLIDGRFWSYNCYACDYHMHISCALNGPQTETDLKGCSVAGETSETCGTSEEPKPSHGENASERKEIDAKTAEAVPVTGSGSGTGQMQPATVWEAEDAELKRQLELEQLKLQLQMNTALANMIGSFNLSSLI